MALATLMREIISVIRLLPDVTVDEQSVRGAALGINIHIYAHSRPHPGLKQLPLSKSITQNRSLKNSVFLARR